MDDIINGIGGMFLMLELLATKQGVIILGMVLLIFIPSCTAYTIWNKPVAESEKIISAQVQLACGSKISHEITSEDYWGIETQVDVVEDGNKSIFCTATSAGRDNLFGTNDDLIAKAENINKSRIAGAWLKTKGTEVIKGFLDGNKSTEVTQP